MLCEKGNLLYENDMRYNIGTIGEKISTVVQVYKNRLNSIKEFYPIIYPILFFVLIDIQVSFLN